ncbi:MAG: adenylate cyclase [Piscirickettsiaceae bacterium]|nr:MAG: adenylate cyclase [Piscirickettsiaceae bacterium]
MVANTKNIVNERNPKKIQLVSADGQISKKDLRLVKQRFMNLHKLKMQRARDVITPRQKIFLDILPLLFHVNHPVLPGYMSADTPAGIADFAPSRFMVQRAKKLGKGFVYQKRAKRHFAIESIFIMGSVGSIAYAKGSDMDLWLCHAPDLSAKALTLLAEKAQAIEKWGDSLGLEVHFFLMDAEKFKSGVVAPLSTESSGSTQHQLLLEEFYRTALYVAGRYPIWWLVPPESEDDYTAFVKNLLDRRFVDRNDVIDFGGLENVPAEEFLGASFWHLYKAIDSPYKSLLKLMLMESYVAEYPHSKWAALWLKERLYQGEVDPNELDPYLILYKVLEDYLLKRKEPRRLELMRYCFYNKLNELGATSASRNKKDWRQEVLDGLLKAWAPLPQYITDALNQKAWSIEQTQQERDRLTKELTYSYRLLMKFSNDNINNKADESNDLMLLGRKLNAAFEQKPGKLERPTVKGRHIQHEDKVVLKQREGVEETSGWVLSRIDDYGDDQLIRQAHSLIELLAWCIDYPILSRRTKFALNPGESNITSREVLETIRDVTTFFNTLPKKPSNLEAYQQQPIISHVMLVINSGLDPMSEFTEKGINLTSERSDALSFGSSRRNLIHTVDMMYRNSWNEIIVAKFSGPEGLMDCLSGIFSTNMIGRNQQLPALICSSYSSPRAMSIAKRVSTLFEDMGDVYKKYTKNLSPRFIVRSSHAYFMMQFSHGKMTSVAIKNEAELWSVLAKPQSIYSPVIFDSFMDEKALLSVITKQHKRGVVQIYYVQQGDVAQLLIFDEKGSLHVEEHEFVNEAVLLQPYMRFVRGSLERRRLAAYEKSKEALTISIECYRLEKTRQHWAFNKVESEEEFFDQGMQVRIAYDSIAEQPHVYCDQKVFSSLDYGKDVYKAAADYVQTRRSSTEPYPVYVTDIDVPLKELGVTDATAIQTIHFLAYKKQIEEKLNR